MLSTLKKKFSVTFFETEAIGTEPGTKIHERKKNNKTGFRIIPKYYKKAKKNINFFFFFCSDGESCATVTYVRTDAEEDERIEVQTKERRNLICLINEIKKEKIISIDGQYEKKKKIGSIREKCQTNVK